MSRLLVTGAGGMLGTAVVAAGRAAGHDVHAASRAELDIRDEGSVAAGLRRLRPEVIINCAGWTDVDGAENYPAGAHAVNATGAGHVARAATAAGAFVVHVSSDYVFDGRATRPYLESDPTRPESVYGASKLAGEREVLAAGGEHAIVRTSWLFGAGGANFVDTMMRLAAEGREEVSVVADQRGCPTWTGHLAPALVQVGERRLEGVAHVAGGGSCTWNELAREVFALCGAEVRVLPATTAETARPALRPAYSVLGSARAQAPRLPEWREGVRGHLGTRGALERARVGSGSRRP